MATDGSAANSELPKQTAKVTRRGFGKFIGVGIGAVIVGGLFALREWYHSQATPVRVIAQTGEIPVRGSKIFQYPTDVAPCILVRTGETDYVAYSRICTHNSCPVFYHPEENAFLCPCHNGLFSVANGAVLQGPPPRPLPRILLRIRGNDILAVGIDNS
jgi:arsenite oxidase small subunit